MKYLIFIFVLLLLSIWLGLEISRGTGYVLIAYHHWTLEMSLWVAIISLLLIFFVLYVCFRTLGRTARINKNLKHWAKIRHARRGRQLTRLGLCKLAEGNWKEAEQLLIKGAKFLKNPLMNYLSAAEAANADQAFDRRDHYLRRAHLCMKGAEVAVSLTQARFQITSQQWEQALASLQHVLRLDPRQPYALKLIKAVYIQLNEWKSLYELLPTLRKYDLDALESQHLFEQDVYSHLLDQAHAKGTQALHETWDSFPRAFHHNLTLLRKYTRYLVIHHDYATAMSLIESTLKKQWDAEMVLTFAQAKGESPAKQLTIAESWLKKYPKEPELLLCLGKLSAREKFWGKAREYLETCLEFMPSAEAYKILADVFHALGDEATALENYRKAALA